MNKDQGDEMLQYMLNEKLIQTRINRKSKEQEFAITEMGWGLMKMLKFFNGEAENEDDYDPREDPTSPNYQDGRDDRHG